MAKNQYQRLTGTKSQHGVVTSGRSSLWLGEDHLLRIDSSGYTETYRRYFLRDIQAVIIRKTIGMPIRILADGMLALLWMICAVSVSDPIWKGIWWGIASLFLVLLIINVLRGPCCAFHIRTAVQVEPIPSITRMRKAHRVFERLRPLVAAAQGEISREEVLARLRGTAQPATAETVAAEAISTMVPLASDIPNPTATEAAPDTGSNPPSPAAG